MAVSIAQGFDSVSAAAQDAAALRRVFETLTAESCPSSYNFHMHTLFSDGKLQPEQLMEQAIAGGLLGLAITDHHSVKGYEQAWQWLQQQVETAAAPLPHLWTGMEINAELLADEVHILAYAFDPYHAALQPYMTYKKGEPKRKTDAAARVIAAIHAASGMAVLAHPARYHRATAELIPAAAALGIDGVETFYAYNNPNPWLPSPKQTEEVKRLGEAYGLFSTCGTDSHGLSLLQRL